MQTGFLPFHILAFPTWLPSFLHFFFFHKALSKICNVFLLLHTTHSHTKKVKRQQMYDVDKCKRQLKWLHIMWATVNMHKQFCNNDHKVWIVIATYLSFFQGAGLTSFLRVWHLKKIYFLMTRDGLGIKAVSCEFLNSMMIFLF